MDYVAIGDALRKIGFAGGRDDRTRLESDFSRTAAARDAAYEPGVCPQDARLLVAARGEAFRMWNVEYRIQGIVRTCITNSILRFPES